MESYCVNKGTVFKYCFYFSANNSFSFLMVVIYSYCFLVNAAWFLDYDMLSLIEMVR